MKQQNKQTSQNLLSELAQMLETKTVSELFGEFKELLGFRIAWLKESIASQLCSGHGIDLSVSELIIMQADGLTKPHMHLSGETLFLPLGSSHGFMNPKGGTLFGEFDESHDIFPLTMQAAEAGEYFTVPAGKIHAFRSLQKEGLTLIGIVNPKIRQAENNFDAVPFRFLNEAEPFKVSLDLGFNAWDLGWSSTSD